MSRILAIVALSAVAALPAQAQVWVDVYNPTRRALPSEGNPQKVSIKPLLDPATGPLSETALHAFLTNVEPHVAFALAEDPYAGFTPASVAAHFDGLRNWVTDRIAIVLNQVSENLPAPRQ